MNSKVGNWLRGGCFGILRKSSILAAAAIATISTFAAPTPENTPDYFVDWVRSRSNLYVDTGVAGKVGVKAEVSFYYIQNDTYPVMLGAWGASNERFNLVMHDNKRCRWEYGSYDSGQHSKPAATGIDWNGVNVSMDTEYGTLCDVTVECSATGAMSSTWTGSNGNSITATMNASEKYGIIDTQATLFLFAAHRKTGSTDGPSQYAYGILRSCKLWTDYDGTGTWTPARDLRPCVKNGRAGLYDAVMEEILYPQGNELEAGPAKLDSGYALGSNAHPGTQWGRIGYAERVGMGDSQWMHLLLTDYTAKGAGDIANLNGGNASWQGSNLKWSQVRFDGWFQVLSDKAGTWKINQKYDDYFAISIDGRNVLFNNSYTDEANSTLAVTEGWHRFTIIAGDTYGGYGCNTNYSGLGYIPFTVSVNDGAAMAFNTSNFPQGSGSNSYTLTSDEDWSDRGPILLSGGAVLDLNGHNLVVKDIACDDFVGSCITNSASKKSVLYFAGEPLKTKAYVDSLIKEVDVKIILAQDGDQVATWTGSVSGDPANANNWEDLAGEPVVPTASYTVKIAGDNVNLQAPAGTDIACKAFEIGNCTLAADCDWRGLSHTPLLVGTANLNGHVLTLNHLAANTGSTFSGGDGSAVEFVPSEAATYETLGESVFIDNIANLTLSGSAKILIRKVDGAGTLTVTVLDLGKTHYAELVQTNGAVNLANDTYTWSVVGGKSNAAGHGVYRMTGGTLTSAWEFSVAGSGVGEFIQTGGNVTFNNWFSIGRKGGRGTYTINGGAMTNTHNNTVFVGAEGGTGTINIGGDASVNFYGLTMGGYDTNGNKGYLNVSGGDFTARNSGVLGDKANGYGEVNQNGGSVVFGQGLTVGGGGTGVYNLQSGRLDVQNAGISIGSIANGEGTLTVRKSGVVNATSIAKGAGKGYMVLDGGKLAAKNENATFINKIDNMRFTSNGAVIDSAGHDVGVANSWFSEAEGSRIVKTGDGTLTFQSLPHVDSVVVSNGTLAVGSDCDNAASASLAHRWSFTSDLKDSITGMSGTMMGSGALGATYDNGVVKLPGGAHGTCWIDLGAGKHPSDSLTVEVWMTLRELRDWVLGFVYGQANVAAFCTRRDGNAGYSCNFDSTGGNQVLGKALEADKQYYVAITFLPDGKGGVAVRQYVKAVGSEGFLATNSYNKDSWSVLSRAPMASTFSLGYYPGSNVNDMKGEFDEVRVWRGALSPDAIALSAAKGPNASAADIAAIVSKNDESVTLGRSVEIASGATLDLGGHTLTQPVLDMGGTVANGSLVVKKGLVVTPGQTMTVADGATLDLSAVTEVALKDASATIPAEGWVIAASPSGGITPAEPRALTGALKGYTLFVTGNRIRIGKRGLMIMFH